MSKERRRHRSEAPHEAAGLYLDSVASRNNLRAVALANEDGLLVAGTRGDFDFEGLAALGVARGNNMSIQSELADRILGEETMHASRVVIGRETFYLASVGARRPSATSAAGALRRILGPALSAAAAA